MSREKICASDDQKLELVLKSGEAPVYPDCFTAEQWEKSAETWRCAISPATGRPVPTTLTRLNPEVGVGRPPYRMVFTMKRTITASPTQPHMTPMTMAVTSPAEGHDTGVFTKIVRVKSSVRLLAQEAFRCVLTWRELLPRLCNTGQ